MNNVTTTTNVHVHVLHIGQAILCTFACAHIYKHISKKNNIYLYIYIHMHTHLSMYRQTLLAPSEQPRGSSLASAAWTPVNCSASTASKEPSTTEASKRLASLRRKASRIPGWPYKRLRAEC